MSTTHLFTGTGRCGTAYVARALTASGFPCTHELYYNPFRALKPHEFDTYRAESSWLAHKYINDHTSWHIVRDPRRVYESFMTRRFFDPETHTPESTRPWYYSGTVAIDGAIHKLNPGEAAERWILGTHERLAGLPKIFIDKPGAWSKFVLELTGNEATVVAPTNLGTPEYFPHPPEISKLAETLEYE